jgi:hypothetical protein
LKAADFRSPTSCFAQIFKFIKMVGFDGIARECGVDRHIKGFLSWDHLVAMVYGMISGAFSLREIEHGMRSFMGGIQNLEVLKATAKSTIFHMGLADVIVQTRLHLRCHYDLILLMKHLEGRLPPRHRTGPVPARCLIGANASRNEPGGGANHMRCGTEGGGLTAASGRTADGKCGKAPQEPRRQWTPETLM